MSSLPGPDIQSSDQTFLDDVVAGLSLEQKQLPCKYFYDQRGSALFDEICELDEYYLARTEMTIMEQYAAEMAFQLGEQILLVEFGSGSSTKTRILLDQLRDPVGYVPVDISEDHLLKTVVGLRCDYPDMEILPVVADFTQEFSLPKPRRAPSRAAVYFPGSTIGNFRPEAARQMIKRIARLLGFDGGLLIGIDLQKDVATIEAAYNDSQGVTDQFNLNVLHRINAELGANFVVDQFRHKAVYNAALDRIEIFVVSCRSQSVEIDRHTFDFQPGEHVLTEYSHKYTIGGFAKLAAGAAGFSLHRSWTDENGQFAVLHLVNDSNGTQCYPAR